jgi:hypothetical protein
VAGLASGVPQPVAADSAPGPVRPATGQVPLCDPDTIAVGPRETDLVPAAHGVARCGGDRAGYARFADQYGFDLLGAPSGPALRRPRDLQPAVYLLPRPPSDPVAARELGHRLRTVLSRDEDARRHRLTAFA